VKIWNDTKQSLTDDTIMHTKQYWPHCWCSRKANCNCSTVKTLDWGKYLSFPYKEAIMLVRHHLPLLPVTFMFFTCMEVARLGNGFASTLPQLTWCSKTESYPQLSLLQTEDSSLFLDSPCKATPPSPCSV